MRDTKRTAQERFSGIMGKVRCVWIFVCIDHEEGKNESKNCESDLFTWPGKRHTSFQNIRFYLLILVSIFLLWGNKNQFRVEVGVYFCCLVLFIYLFVCLPTVNFPFVVSSFLGLGKCLQFQFPKSVLTLSLHSLPILTIPNPGNQWFIFHPNSFPFSWT